MSDPADILWWVFLATLLAILVLVGGFALAMVSVQRRRAAEHRLFAQRLLAAHEEERARVAREVHDDAVQRLVLVSHELDRMATSDLPAATVLEPGLVSIRTQVDGLATDLRNLAHSLHPAVIEDGGLAPALDLLADEMGRLLGLQVDLAIPDALPKLPVPRALALYRIAQEALHNVIKHSGTTSASIRLGREDGGVELVIADQGSGFDLGEGAGRWGIGLRSIRERAQLLGGTATITSGPGSGTTVRVVIPAGEEET